MKNLFIYSICLLLINISNAQAQSLDKNKLLTYFQNQQFEEAIEYLAPLDTGNPPNLELLNYIGYANYMNDNPKEAEKYFERIFAIDSNNVNSNRYLAIIKSGNSAKEALPYAQRLIHLQQNNAQLYGNLANLFQRVGNKDSALNYYRLGYQLKPNNIKLATGLASLLIEDSLYQSADSILEAGLSKDSLNTDYLKLRVLSAFNAKDFPNVLIPGERLLGQGELSIGSLNKLAIAHYNLKNYNDCIRVCEYMKKNEIAVEATLYYEAKSWAYLKDFNKSNDVFRMCITLAISKTAELYYYNMGANYEELKQFKESTNNYDTAYYLFKNPLMLYNLGRIYESKLGNINLAKKYYRQYILKAKPVDPEEIKAYKYTKSVLNRKKQ
jgi:tetratricopeptide (TPR) repeat protein